MLNEDTMNDYHAALAHWEKLMTNNRISQRDVDILRHGILGWEREHPPADEQAATLRTKQAAARSKWFAGLIAGRL